MSGVKVIAKSALVTFCNGWKFARAGKRDDNFISGADTVLRTMGPLKLLHILHNFQPPKVKSTIHMASKPRAPTTASASLIYEKPESLLEVKKKTTPQRESVIYGYADDDQSIYKELNFAMNQKAEVCCGDFCPLFLVSTCQISSATHPIRRQSRSEHNRSHVPSFCFRPVLRAVLLSFSLLLWILTP